MPITARYLAYIALLLWIAGKLGTYKIQAKLFISKCCYLLFGLFAWFLGKVELFFWQVSDHVKKWSASENLSLVLNVFSCEELGTILQFPHCVRSQSLKNTCNLLRNYVKSILTNLYSEKCYFCEFRVSKTIISS